MTQTNGATLLLIGNAKSFTYNTTEIIVYNANYKQVGEKISEILSTKKVKVEKKYYDNFHIAYLNLNEGKLRYIEDFILPNIRKQICKKKKMTRNLKRSWMPLTD